MFWLTLYVNVHSTTRKQFSYKFLPAVEYLQHRVLGPEYLNLVADVVTCNWPLVTVRSKWLLLMLWIRCLLTSEHLQPCWFSGANWRISSFLLNFNFEYFPGCAKAVGTSNQIWRHYMSSFTFCLIMTLQFCRRPLGPSLWGVITLMSTLRFAWSNNWWAFLFLMPPFFVSVQCLEFEKLWVAKHIDSSLRGCSSSEVQWRYHGDLLQGMLPRNASRHFIGDAGLLYDLKLSMLSESWR